MFPDQGKEKDKPHPSKKEGEQAYFEGYACFFDPYTTSPLIAEQFATKFQSYFVKTTVGQLRSKAEESGRGFAEQKALSDPQLPTTLSEADGKTDVRIWRPTRVRNFVCGFAQGWLGCTVQVERAHTIRSKTLQNEQPCSGNFSEDGGLRHH